MKIAETKKAKTVQEILRVNLQAEKEAVEYYTQLLENLYERREKLKFEFFKLEHEIRHIIIDEQEHIAELKLLLGEKEITHHEPS